MDENKNENLEEELPVVEKKRSFFDVVGESVGNLGFSVDSVGEIANNIGDIVVDAGKQTMDIAGEATSAIVGTVQNVADSSIEGIKNLNLEQYKLDPEEVLRQTMKIPGIAVDREAFLRKEFKGKYSDNVIYSSVKNNPAYAGITKEEIDNIASRVINYETNKVTTLSFASGLPGGLAMIATVPADVAQYFGHVIITTQKLAYLYGFDDLQLEDESLADDNLNTLMIFLGVMFGVNGANAAIKVLAEAISVKVSKSLGQKALTKTTIYPIVKKISTTVGLKMTKDIFTKNVSKIVPVLGGVVSGGVTYVTFKPGCVRLQESFRELNLSDPAFYADIVEVEVTEEII